MLFVVLSFNYRARGQTVKYNYVSLNKFIEESENDLGLDELFHLAVNGKIHFYFKVNKIEEPIETEFDSNFTLTAFGNHKHLDRYDTDYMGLADYNYDLLSQEQLENLKESEPFGIIYSIERNMRNPLDFIQFYGLIEIPRHFINEYKKEVILKEWQAYYFLRDETGRRETNFVLNFEFDNNELVIPNGAIYILPEEINKHTRETITTDDIENLLELAERNLNENIELKTTIQQQAETIAQLEEKLSKVDISTDESAVDFVNFSIYGHTSENLSVLAKLAKIIAEKCDPDNPHSYPSKDDFAEYVKRYYSDSSKLSEAFYQILTPEKVKNKGRTPKGVETFKGFI